MYFLAKAVTLFCLSRNTFSQPLENLSCTKQLYFWEHPVSQPCEPLPLKPEVITVISKPLEFMHVETAGFSIKEEQVDT